MTERTRDDGPRSRRHPFRIAQGDLMDPDLYRPPSPDWEHTGAVYVTETSRTLDAAHEAVRMRRGAGHLLTVTCLPGHRCGQKRGPSGRAWPGELARVYRTPHGLLYLAPLVMDREFMDRQRAESGRFVRVYHPVTHGVADVGRRAFETVWAAKGWQLAAPDATLTRGRQPQWRLMVRDLLDRDDLDHVPLRAKCHRGGELPPMDRMRLLGALAQLAHGSRGRMARPSARRVSIDHLTALL